MTPISDAHAPGSVDRELARAMVLKLQVESALSRHQVEVLDKCREDSALVDLMAIVGRSDRTKFRHRVLNPLIVDGLIEMTIPDKPRSSKQKYRLTEKGLKVIQDSRFRIQD